MVTALLLLGAAIVAVTVIVTSQRYVDLPDRLPIHFGITGVVDRYGRRYMAWLLVVVQLTVAVLQLVAYELTDRAGALALGVSVLAIFLAVQILILHTARSGKTRVNVLGFWIFFALVLTLGILAGTKL